jgi:hypothetical protein
MVESLCPEGSERRLTNPNKINYGLVVGFVSIVIAVLAVAVAGQTMMKLNDQVTPEKYNWRAVGDGTMIDWLNENFVSENEWKPHNEALSEIFEQLDSKVDGLQSSVTLLQAKGDVVTQPITPNPPASSTINLFLKVSDNKGNTKSGYPRDVPAILIQGESTLLEKAYVITIKDPSGNFVKDKFGTTLSDGDISQAWIPINALGGTYLVTIKIDNKIDTIEFTLL